LPFLSEKEMALVDLYQILDEAHAPLSLFDKVVGFIEKHYGTTFELGAVHDRRATLLQKVRSRFPAPGPEAVTVALERDEEVGTNAQRGPHNMCVVMHWDCKEALKLMLLDPFLFGKL
jgi:hypothetical protein